VPLAAGFGLGGGGTARLGVPVPNPGCLAVAGGAFLAAIFSLLAFCVQSGQVMSFALADWNHLPQVLQRIFVLLMYNFPCTTRNYYVAFFGVGMHFLF
jgi:hypothetical protein